MSGSLMGAEARLNTKDVALLVANTPQAIEVKQRGGCPTSDYSEASSDVAMVQLRNSCPQSGSGLIGNYVVDLHSGRIWADIDRTKEIDSAQLRAVRKKILSKRLTGGGRKDAPK